MDSRGCHQNVTYDRDFDWEEFDARRRLLKLDRVLSSLRSLTSMNADIEGNSLHRKGGVGVALLSSTWRDGDNEDPLEKFDFNSYFCLTDGATYSAGRMPSQNCESEGRLRVS